MSDTSPRQFHVPRLAIIGCGLIGGSLAMALKQQNMVAHVVGAGRTRDSLDLALSLKVIDQIADDALSAIEQADIIVIATPVNAIAEVLEAIRPGLNSAQVITDVGSVKSGVCEFATTILGDNAARFVPGHPVAGRENSGVAAATADLFQNHNVVLTPSATTDADAIELIQQMWDAAGATVSVMDPQQHDRVLALTSHLPHVLAYAMVDLFANSEDLTRAYAMAAGGFYDFSRTASSDAEMWRDICLMNQSEILQHIDQFQARLNYISGMIKKGEGAALENLFAAAKEARSQVVEKRKQ